jgi:flagellin
MTAGEGINSVSGLQDSTTYTVTSVAGVTGINMTISATIGGVEHSETMYEIAVPATGTTSDVKFNALGLTVKVNDNLAATSDGSLVANAGTAANFQVGTSSDTNDHISIMIQSCLSTDLSLSKDMMLVATDALTFLDSINGAISTVSGKRGDVGAAQNRLAYANANLSVTVENYTAAESTIRDVDMAAEMTTFTKNQILVQAGTAMLAQANVASQQVLSLFK